MFSFVYRGVTFNLQDLTMFLVNDFSDLLVNTFLDEPLKQQMQDFADYITNNKTGFLCPLFEEYKSGKNNKEIITTLKEIGNDYSNEIDYVKLSKELEVFFSLLLLNNGSEDALQMNLKKEKKSLKRLKFSKNDDSNKEQKTE